jgi:transmembrane sensor
MTDHDISDAAASWIARSRDPRFTDWAALTDWLEADPAHNRAYEAGLLAHDVAGEIADGPVVPLLAEPRSMAGPRWRLWGTIGVPTAAAVAAAALLMVGLPQSSPVAETMVATQLGERRALRLDDGTLIQLNGGSRLVLNDKNRRTARLESGEAMFSVVHDEARPFTVDIDGQRLVDIGTSFDVVRTAHRSEVAVAEGEVLYDPNGAAIRLGAGRVLRKRDGSQLVEVTDARASDIGTWRQGKLVYRDAPLSQIAADLGRLMGEPVAVAPNLAARPFTGALIVDNRNPDQTFARLGKVLDVAFSHRAGDWYLSSKAGAAR